MLQLFKPKEHYVKEFVYIPATYTPGRTTAETEEEKRLVASLERSKKLAEKLHVLQYLEYEHIFVLIRDLNDFKFTVHIEKGTIGFEIGWDVSKEPTLVVPLRQENIHHFEDILKEGLTEPGRYRIAYFLYIPALKSFYNSPLIKEAPKDKRFLRLHNFIQAEIVNEHLVKHNGEELRARATIVNVDGQWLVFPGWQGDPDIRYSATLKQTMEYYKCIRYEFPKAKNLSLREKKKLLDRYFELRDSTTSYVRPDHL
jgi:hypothetical protein